MENAYMSQHLVPHDIPSSEKNCICGIFCKKQKVAVHWESFLSVFLFISAYLYNFTKI